MDKYGLVMNSFERNVVQIALTHLQEMHSDLVIEEKNNPSRLRHHKDVVKACREMLISLK